MKRFLFLLTNELKLFRTSIPIHLVAVLQPTVMFLLMSVILVTPTFDVYMTQPTTSEGQALASAMDEVGSPIGMPYVRTHFVENIEPAAGQRQVIHVEVRDEKNTAVEVHGRIAWANGKGSIVKEGFPLGYGVEFVDIADSVGTVLRRCFGT